MQKFAGFMAACYVLLITLAGGVHAQNAMDASSLLAFEDLTIENAVEGELPAAAEDGDLLEVLLSDAKPDVAVGEVELGADEPPQATKPGPALDAVAEEDLAAAIEGMPAGDDDDDEVKGVTSSGGERSPKAADAPAKLTDVAAELGLTGNEEVVPPPPPTRVVPPAEDDLLSLLAGEEESATADVVVSEPAVTDAPPPAVVTAPAVDLPSTPSTGDDDLMSLLAGDEESVTADAAAPASTASDAAPPTVAVGAAVPPLGEPPAVADDNRRTDSLVHDLVNETANELVSEREPLEAARPPVAPPRPPAAPVEIVDAPPAFVDDMPIGDDLIRSLTDEVKNESAPPPVDTASMDAIISDLIDEAESVVTEPAAEPALPVAPTAPALVAERVVEEPVVEEPVIDVRLPDPVVEPDDGAASAVTRSAADVAVDAFMIQEELKRIAEREHGLESLRLGEAALADRQFQNAVTRFEEALRFIPDQPNTAEARARARRGLAAAYYVQALAFERMNDLEKAYAAAINAVNYGYIKGEDAVRRLKLKIEKGPIAPPPTKDRLWETDDYAGRQREIKEWLKRGREAYLAGEYAKARSAFESVLARDRYNKEAIRMLRRASEKMYDRSSMELESTRARMMAVVRDTWNPRDYGILETPIESKVGRAAKKPDDEVERERIIEKMKLIRIPEVDFRQANIRDVIHFLHGQSVENDSTEGEGRKGINLILKLDDADGGGAGEASPGAPRDPFASTGDVFGDPAPTPGAGGGSDILVTFSALDITLKEALDIVVDIAHLKYRIRGSVVMIVPFDEASGEIIHRMYDVLPSVVTKFGELGEALKSSDRNASGGGFTTLDPGAPIGGGSAEQDWKGFFSEMGVEWPQRSSIKYVPTIGKIIVANTAENLTVFEKVLSVLNVIPYQIEIEARFVEVAQTDIDSLGLEWLLTDNWELAERKNQAGLPLSARERVVLNSNAGNGGFTKGNRFLTTSAPAGMTIADDVLSLSAVLTNPELTVILHALQRRGNTDLLSAPKITTQSGQEASLKVVTEYIYPTEFEPADWPAITLTGDGATMPSLTPVLIPATFHTREVGVILSVLPEVTPEGQMINLTMSPEVVSEPTWKDYATVPGQTLLQPFFHTRQLNTSMLIYNGATVVMGGMITEVRHDVDDKIPFLGDIPIIGRLFRSKYETSEKRNLLIFVTARLVDPAGRALDQARLDVFNNVIAEGLMDKEPGAKK